ncbi:hypothetical protein CHELA17_60749 [Chelatococcus asaccharovorans]|nr:hypothetical protein CHELA17_60749 [Chelatococcus asaccharovorans]
MTSKFTVLDGIRRFHPRRICSNGHGVPIAMAVDCPPEVARACDMQGSPCSGFVVNHHPEQTCPGTFRWVGR